ncbi:hypothetical protein HDU76_004932 [Blyttiomyces sp. JEL0837]|nr:hypothetical protein HDU76_004932 [Blyttiomyces sp. JEL0837]
MTSILLNPIALKSTAAATFLLTLKLFLTITIQGGKRFPAGTRPPEDAALNLNKALGKGAVQSYGTVSSNNTDDKVVKEAKLADLRWGRIVMNDLENIPIGLIVAWSSLLTPYSTSVHSGLALAFAASRIAHTIVYAKQLQPHRAIAWFGGWVCILGMSVNGVIGALTL